MCCFKSPLSCSGYDYYPRGWAINKWTHTHTRTHFLLWRYGPEQGSYWSRWVNSLEQCWINVEGIKSHHHLTNTHTNTHSDTHVHHSWGIPCHVWPGATTVQNLWRWRNLIVPRTEAGLVSGTLKHPTKNVDMSHDRRSHSFLKIRGEGGNGGEQGAVVLYPVMPITHSLCCLTYLNFNV